MAQKQNSPAATSAAYDYMAPKWWKISTLIDGTDAMREAAQSFLPQHEEEGDIAYQERLSRATLLNMLQFTLDSWVGKPFNKPVQIGEDVPAEIKKLLDNVNMQGDNINVFARNWFKDGLAKGFSHVLVDFPRVDPNPNGLPRTLADDRAEKVRPFLVHIPPENLIFAYAEVINGVEQLLHIRIRETITVKDGFLERYVNRIRVIEPGLVTVYEERKNSKTKKLEWIQLTDETYTFDLNFVPLVTFYADREGFMCAKPPLSDLADLNIRHWQSTSDQIAVLTVARFPILATSGAIDPDKLTIGPHQWLNTPDPTGRFYYVEHTGAAIAAGRQDLLDLEESMSQYGATFLRRRPGGASATARALDSAETTCPLQDMAIRFRDSLNLAMQYMAKWLKKDNGGTLSITTEFGLTDEGGKALDTLIAARAAREISRKRFVAELKRFGVLGDDFEFSINETELKAEPPPPTPPTPAVPANSAVPPKEKVPTNGG